MLDTQLLIVGAGPVGLATALAAAREGLRVRVIDQYQRAALHSYAPAVHAGTLRLLEGYGLAEDLRRQGTPVSRLAVYRAGAAEPVGGIDLSPILTLPQFALESALETALAREGVAVAWRHQALSLEPDARGVTTLVGEFGETNGGQPAAWSLRQVMRLRSGAVIGADGYSSTVRRLLGARYVNVGRASSYALFEFRSPAPLEPEVRVVFGGRTADVLWPIDAHRGRWSFQIPSDFEGEPDSTVLERLASARAPWFEAPVERVEWATTVCFERRLVDRFGEGRVWLAGEAAHLTTPIGVHNMNVGMREGRDLVRRLQGVLCNGTPFESLEDYSNERRTEWLCLLAARDRVECLPEAKAWARELGGRLVDCLPASGDDLGELLAAVGLRLH